MNAPPGFVLPLSASKVHLAEGGGAAEGRLGLGLHVVGVDGGREAAEARVPKPFRPELSGISG
jgi:hypothetical protein